MRPNKTTQPRSALSIDADARGPGVGGIIPCDTSNPANKGMEKYNKDLFVLLVKLYKIGTKITKATSKKMGIDIISPAIPSAHPLFLIPNVLIKDNARRSAPPETRSTSPNIVP